MNMKICFWIEHWMHALFECPEDVNENNKVTLKRFCDEFCVISLFLRKLILGVT